jgi:putative SOS response-associated peptidase YedK
MPVLLQGAQQAAWLAERPFASADFAALAATAPDRSLAVHRVSPDVNRVACDDPRLIEPVTGAADQPDFLGDLLG